MTTKDIPDEYMHCFNIMDEIPRYDPMEIEHQVGNIVETKQEPSLKKLLNLADYETARKEENKKQQTENSEPNEPSIESGSKGDKKKKKKSEAKVRGSYRSYAPEQIQELLDLVIEQGLSARKTGFIVGIVERIAQHYVKQYKDDNEKRLPGQKKSRVLHQRSLSRVIQTFFAVTLTRSLKQYFGKQGMHCLKSFPSIQSLNLSSLHRHLLRHASLTLKKLEPGVAARTAQRTLELRREREFWSG
ncbi:hypothetical protein EDC96DRAFT_588327 [Choanephora cucurbitarum]|nr:hypothetical protein EDC96DRAFT_588327 [Choanephora cucurbitarum]